MAPKDCAPAGVSDEGGCCAGNVKVITTKAPLRQSASPDITYQRVTGDVGPIHLIGGPRVVVECHATRAFCWVENPIWGWPDASREFLNPASPAILRYAQALALRIRDAALAEEARRARLEVARKQEVRR